jgi:hypothetical protein
LASRARTAATPRSPPQSPALHRRLRS